MISIKMSLGGKKISHSGLITPQAMADFARVMGLKITTSTSQLDG